MRKPEKIDLAMHALDVTVLSRSRLHDLGALFSAIRKCADDNAFMRNMAAIGQQLAEEWELEFEANQKEFESWRAEADHSAPPDTSVRNSKQR